MKTTSTAPANIINHIVLDLDCSLSMEKHEATVVKVADNLIKHLAQRSTELEQETRITIFTFSSKHTIQCVIWDMDVLRLPSIAKFYKTGGNTAFIDATLKAIDDLSETPERYGDHSFLLYVLTDGEENDSIARPATLQQRLASLPSNWTAAAMVPNAMGRHEAKKFGFPDGNIEIWDASTNAGVTEAGERVRQSTDNFMQARSTGIRSTTNLFSTSAATVNAATIQQSGLRPLTKNAYVLVPIPPNRDQPEKPIEIKPFIESCGLPFQVGKGFYQLTKTELIQPDKEIAIMEKATQRIYVGDEARQLVGLPQMVVRVKPDYNREYDIFVQSNSKNRHLMVGTKLLYVK